MSHAPHHDPAIGDTFTRRHRVLTILVLGLLVGLGPFTIDLYLPAFPDVKGDLGITDAQVQLTLSATTLGFALGQLLVGPLSDRFGRRAPLLAATTVHVVASVGVALAPDLATLSVLRVLQGLGAAGGSVVAMAMVRDLYSGGALITALSRLALIMGLAPIAAPILGSWMVAVMDWRGIFWSLAAYAAFVIGLQLIFLRETLPLHRRNAPGHARLRDRYRAVLTDRTFIGVAVIGSAAFGGIFAYLATSSLLLQEVYGFTPAGFGLIFALCSVGVFIGTQTSPYFSRRYGPQWVLAGSTTAMALAAAAVVVTDLAGSGIWGLVPSLLLFTTAFGFTMPNVQVLALRDHANEAGTAASLLGACNMTLAGLVSPVVGAFRIENAIPMGLVMLLLALLGTASLWLIVRPRTVTPITP